MRRRSRPRARVRTGPHVRVRSGSVAVLAVVTAVALTGCAPARSAEAFCGTLEEHKARYTEAMAGAGELVEQGGVEGVVGGLAQSVAAIGDLRTMWSELADVAPEEIRPDVETLRDAYAEQVEAAPGNASDPLSALGSAVMTGLLTSGSTQRVDKYIAANCSSS